MPDETIHSKNHHDWLGQEGFALASDVGYQILRNVELTPIQAISSDQVHFSNVITRMYPSNAALYSVTRAIYRATDLSPGIDPGSIAEMYGVSQDTLERTKTCNAFYYGLGDRDFAFAFSSFCASQVIYEFIGKKFIDPRAGQHITLSDWANIIGSGWFSELMHDLALTKNGVYGGKGNFPEDYRPGQLAHRLDEEGIYTGDSAFECSLVLDPETNISHPEAKLTNAVHQGLRREMRFKDSIGCPVARYGTVFFKGILETDPHVQNLIEQGHLSTHPAANPNKVIVHQDRTAIDESLRVLAVKLREYEQLYGNPRFKLSSDDSLAVTHVQNLDPYMPEMALPSEYPQLTRVGGLR